MESRELLVDAFGRIREVVHGVVGGLGVEELTFRPDADANSIAWLIWHATRIQDDHVSGVAGIEQVWTADGWAARFGLPFDDTATGYGHRTDDVAAVRAPGDLLTGYHDAVFEHTLRYLDRVDAAELDRVVDRSWDPPVTAGVRLVSVIADGLQHVGQAAYVRGLVERSG
jgi:Protein of unknown function (DUF664)